MPLVEQTQMNIAQERKHGITQTKTRHLLSPHSTFMWFKSCIRWDACLRSVNQFELESNSRKQLTRNPQTRQPIKLIVLELSENAAERDQNPSPKPLGH